MVCCAVLWWVTAVVWCVKVLLRAAWQRRQRVPCLAAPTARPGPALHVTKPAAPGPSASRLAGLRATPPLLLQVIPLIEQMQAALDPFFDPNRVGAGQGSRS